MCRIQVVDAFTGHAISEHDGEVHIERWDGVIHVVDVGLSPLMSVSPSGHFYGECQVSMICGRSAKLHLSSRNRYTEDAATCLVCVAGGYR